MGNGCDSSFVRHSRGALVKGEVMLRTEAIAVSMERASIDSDCWSMEHKKFGHR